MFRQTMVMKFILSIVVVLKCKNSFAVVEFKLVILL